MNLGRIVVSLLKGKTIAVIGVGAVLAGGTTAVMAATPAGQHLIQTITTHTASLGSHDSSTNQAHKGNKDDSSHSSTANGNKDDSSHRDGTSAANDHDKICPGLDDVQRLAGKFSLNTASISDAIQAICTLHDGTFKATTPNGIAVVSSRVLGYGEIDQLLTYAQYLASHDKANATGKLTSDNVRTYLAAALRSCGTISLMTCVKQNIPSFWPGNTGSSTKENSISVNSNTNVNSNSGDGHSSDNKNGGGRSTSMIIAHS